MMLARLLLLGSLAVSLLVCASDVSAAKPKGKGKGQKHAIHGVVKSVDTDKNGNGTIVVQVHHHKKGEKAKGDVTEKKIQVGISTTFAFVSGKKGAMEKKPATFADVKQGEHVRIVEAGQGIAREVDIHKGGKKKT